MPLLARHTLSHRHIQGPLHPISHNHQRHRITDGGLRLQKHRQILRVGDHSIGFGSCACLPIVILAEVCNRNMNELLGSDMDFLMPLTWHAGIGVL